MTFMLSSTVSSLWLPLYCQQTVWYMLPGFLWLSLKCFYAWATLWLTRAWLTVKRRFLWEKFLEPYSHLQTSRGCSLGLASLFTGLAGVFFIWYLLSHLNSETTNMLILRLQPDRRGPGTDRIPALTASHYTLPSVRHPQLISSR